MKLIKKRFPTPGTRWRCLAVSPNTASRSYKLETRFISKAVDLIGHRNSRRKKFTHLPNHLYPIQISEMRSNLITWDFFISRFYKKEFIVLRNVFSQIYLRPSTVMCYPGKVYKAFSLKGVVPLSTLVNRIVPVGLIPLNSIISLLANTVTQFPTYARAPGSKAIRLRLNKKIKLIEILLPSQVVKFFPQHTLATWSWHESYNNRITLGKRGLDFLRSKKLNVRGVAMNPIDHPNGGRTKAKQPELTPWGWVAKRNK